MRSPSDFGRSTASVRSIAEASTRTLIASTARARSRAERDAEQDRNRDARRATDAKRRPPGFRDSPPAKAAMSSRAVRQEQGFQGFINELWQTRMAQGESRRLASSIRQHDLADVLRSFPSAHGRRRPRAAERSCRSPASPCRPRSAARRCSSTARAIAAFSCTGRGRSAEPVCHSRFIRIGRKSTVALGGRWNAICTMRPSIAAAS